MDCKAKNCNRKSAYKTGYCRKHNHPFLKYGKIPERTIFDPNEVVIEGDICKIAAYNKQSEFVNWIIIDKDNLDKVKRYKWCLKNKGYPITGGRKKSLYMHQILLDIPDGKKCDHINGNPLDNRMENLRICNHYRNIQNRGIQSNNTTGYKGVTFDKSVNRFRARIYNKGRQIYLGVFKSKIDAAIAYNKGALRYHGEFAVLNKPLHINLIGIS